ncbi:hypothetical protein AWC36_05055 [Brenneria goodwinii]|nr:hypothetical protein AWC36_05055 [Brenneria goodwinii]
MCGFFLRLIFTASVVGIDESLTSFAISFLLAEVISVVAEFTVKEGSIMGKILLSNTISAVKNSLDVSRSFRLSLLMSL